MRQLIDSIGTVTDSAPVNEDLVGAVKDFAKRKATGIAASVSDVAKGRKMTQDYGQTLLSAYKKAVGASGQDPSLEHLVKWLSSNNVISAEVIKAAIKSINPQLGKVAARLLTVKAPPESPLKPSAVADDVSNSRQITSDQRYGIAHIADFVKKRQAIRGDDEALADSTKQLKTLAKNIKMGSSQDWRALFRDVKAKGNLSPETRNVINTMISVLAQETA